VNVRRAICAVALVAGLALSGCGSAKSNTSAGTPAGVTSTSAAAGSGPSGGTAGQGSGGGSNTGGGTGVGGGGSNTGGGGGTGGGGPKPGAPAECNDIAAAPGLHEIGDTLDQLDTPDTAAAAKTTLHSDAAQLTTIAGKTGNATLKARLTSFATSVNAVADTGTDNTGAMMGFATSLRDVSQTVMDVCGISIG
jgi:hypothetical protein